VSAARSLASMRPTLETRKARTSLIDAEWERIAGDSRVEPEPSLGFRSSSAPSYVPTLGRHLPLVHTDTLKMRLPVLVLRDAPLGNGDPTNSPPPARSEPPRQVNNEGMLGAQASDASQTLRSVPPPPRSWSVFQLSIFAATTLVGFVVGYGVLFAAAMGGSAEHTHRVSASTSAPVVAATAESSPRSPDGAAAVVAMPVKELQATSSNPSELTTPKLPTKPARALGRRAPQPSKRANPASDNPY
jgi:hypothetical protein